MKRAAVILLAIAAALAAPVRQACGTTCVEPPATVATPPPCHETAETRAPQPDPEAAHCTHDHSGSIRPALRAALPDLTAQPAMIDTQPVVITTTIVAASPRAPAGLSPGSPPIRLISLRI